MMQATQAKQAIKPDLIGKGYEPTLSQKTDTTKVQESSVDSQKQANYRRMFEAYSDCV
jgi:hypothetical protein